MVIHSVSFDDDSDEELCVFSGSDLLISHYDIADLDWAEVAERSMLDERRGLVIAQVAVLEDLVDELILYLEDPEDVPAYQARLDRQTIGPRLDQLERLLSSGSLLDQHAEALFTDLRAIVNRRNELAHGTLHWQAVGGPRPMRNRTDIELEWVIRSRRSRSARRITMAGLRQDLYEAIGAFSSMLQFAEALVETARPPRHFRGRTYLGGPAS